MFNMEDTKDVDCVPVAATQQMPDQEFEYVACQDCNIAIFRDKSESWRNYCSSCYSANVRHCSTCDGKMSMQSQSWQKVCGKCYLSARQATHVVCPSCTGPAKFLLSMPVGSTACRKCREAQFKTNNQMSSNMFGPVKIMSTIDQRKRLKTSSN